MSNLHIIVGEPRRCICGNYGTHEHPNIVTCPELLKKLEDSKELVLPTEIIRELVGRLIVDCDKKT